MQLARRAFSLALAKTGNRIAANIAIIAMTTKSSMRVKALRRDLSSRFFHPCFDINIVHSFAVYDRSAKVLLETGPPRTTGLS
jgi:hypothetical protein